MQSTCPLPVLFIILIWGLDMKLYLLKQRDDSKTKTNYSANASVLVRAINSRFARIIADNNEGSEQGKIWRDTSKTTCTPVRLTGKAGVVMLQEW